MVALLAACSPAGNTASPSSAPLSTTQSASATPGGLTAASASTAPTGVTKVLTILLENHGVAAVTAGMPGLMKLATTY